MRNIIFFCILVLVLLVAGAAIVNVKTQNKGGIPNAADVHNSPQSETPQYSETAPEAFYEHELLRFAVVADIHIGQNINGTKEGNSKRLETAIEISKKYNAEFFVALGDITQTGTPAEFDEAKRILEAGNIVYFTSIGNHDVFQDQNTYQKYFGSKYTKITYRLRKTAPNTYKPIDPDADLVFLNLSEAQGEFGDAIGKRQSEWLEKEMKLNQSRTNRMVLVFAGGALNTMENNQKEKVTLYLCQSNISAFIFGGPHRYYAQYSPCFFDWLYKYDTRVPQYYEISPGTIGQLSTERSAQVSIIHVFPDFRIEVERIPIEVNRIYPEYIE